MLRINNHLLRSYIECNWGENHEDYKFENLNYINKFNGKLLEFKNEIGGVFIYDMQEFNSISIGCLWINKNYRGINLTKAIFEKLYSINNRIYFFCLEHLVTFYKRKNFQELYLEAHNCYLMSNYQITSEYNNFIF